MHHLHAIAAVGVADELDSDERTAASLQRQVAVAHVALGLQLGKHGLAAFDVGKCAHLRFLPHLLDIMVARIERQRARLQNRGLRARGTPSHMRLDGPVAT